MYKYFLSLLAVFFIFPATIFACFSDFAGCSSNSDCCSNICGSGNVCVPASSSCIPDGQSCAANPNNCCSGSCVAGQCQTLIPTSTPAPNCSGTCRTPPCLSGETVISGICPNPISVCCLANTQSSGCIPAINNSCSSFPGNPNLCRNADGFMYCCDTTDPAQCLQPTPVIHINPVPPVTCLVSNGMLGIQTALGCAPIDGTSLLNTLLQWGVGVGAGIALLLIGYAGFQIATATGDPKKMKAGQELLISALTGLLLIALAIVIINFLGFTVLKLPGFQV